MTENETKEVKSLIMDSKVELIIEYKTDELSKLGIETTNDLSLLSDPRKKLFYCAVEHFHVKYISDLNNGDIVGIKGWQKGSRDYEGLSHLRQKVFVDNNYGSLFWVKGAFHDIGTNTSSLEFYPIDVLVTSSSRHMLIPHCIDSFKRMLITERRLNWILHEDAVFPSFSSKLLDYAKDHFDEIYTHNPKIGLGMALDLMLGKIKSPYVWYAQEDWIAEEPINLDRLIWTMDKHKEINCIALHKYKIMGSSSGFSQSHYDFSGLDLCMYNGWPMLPGLWRVSKVREKWKRGGWKERPEANFTLSFGSHQQRLDEKYCYKNLGVYWLGKPGDPRKVMHIGDAFRTTSWTMNNGDFGGNWESYESADMYRAPWVKKFDVNRLR